MLSVAIGTRLRELVLLGAGNPASGGHVLGGLTHRYICVGQATSAAWMTHCGEDVCRSASVKRVLWVALDATAALDQDRRAAGHDRQDADKTAYPKAPDGLPASNLTAHGRYAGWAFGVVDGSRHNLDVTDDVTVRTETPWVVNDIWEADRPAWEALFQGYGDFYEIPMPPAKLDVVWRWLQDPAHEVTGLLVRSPIELMPVGLAHYRPFARPLHGSTGCYLDDLFITPTARGTGAVDALLAEVQRRAQLAGWDVVRWMTREGNSRARSTYDRLARLTDFLTYDLQTSPPRGPR